MNAANRSHFVYVTFIRTTPAKLWEALTEPQFIRQYWFNTTVECGWKKGSPWKMVRPDGSLTDTGEILEIDPPRRLVHTLHVLQDPAAVAEAPSRVEYQITQVGDRCRLTLIHTGRGPATIEYTSGGWETILGGLKELLETGEVAAAAM